MNSPTRPSLTPDTRLQRRSGLVLHLTGANTVQIDLPSGTIHCGEAALRVLERFGKPATLREIAKEHVAGAQDWIDLLNAVLLLAQHGVLRQPSVENEPDETPAYAFDNPGDHIQMLNDAPRTERFIAAIASTVRPGDVAIDIGTGTGVLAMAAARAGAGHVYAIEAGGIAEQAEEIINANGFADRITVVRGWSTTVSLPKRADVLITETIGNDPLGERILETIADARRRLLNPHPRIVPSRLSIVATAVQVPDSWIGKRIYTAKTVADWKDRYGFDFSALVSDRPLAHRRWVPASVARDWTRLTAPTTIIEIDLASGRPLVDAATTAIVERAGRLDGVLLHFNAELAPGVTHTTDPHLAGPDASWRNVLTIHRSRAVNAGEALRIAYRWRASSGLPGLSIEEAATHGAGGSPDPRRS